MCTIWCSECIGKESESERERENQNTDDIEIHGSIASFLVGCSENTRSQPRNTEKPAAATITTQHKRMEYKATTTIHIE